MTTAATTKTVYRFGAGSAEGDASMKHLLGGKGANLAEMCRLDIPVPAGFTITTEACNLYTQHGRAFALDLLDQEVRAGVAFIEQEMGKKFGDSSDPLLLSVRSGARASMPGRMDTILNLGLNDEAVAGLIAKSGNARFAWDSYRRFIQMYGDVVMGLKPVSKEDHEPFELLIEMVKEERGLKLDSELSAADLQELV
ncbi:MAG: PEP/pyruvate-binding domain-containing protein, partial [Saprospiraceae bacterium]